MSYKIHFAIFSNDGTCWLAKESFSTVYPYKVTCKYCLRLLDKMRAGKIEDKSQCVEAGDG